MSSPCPYLVLATALALSAGGVSAGDPLPPPPPPERPKPVRAAAEETMTPTTIPADAVPSSWLEPAKPLPGSPPAAQLVRAVVGSEQWVHEAKSFRMRVAATWRTPPEAIERRRQDLRKQFPDADLTDLKRWSELLPERAETLEWAFDEKRFYCREDDPSYMHRASFWDGSYGYTHENYPHHDQEHYAIESSPHRMGSVPLTKLSWLRSTSPTFWWSGQFVNDWNRSLDEKDLAAEWTVVGRQDFRGTDCWVLESNHGWNRWYVGVDRPRLYGHTTYVRPSEVQEEEQVLSRIGRHFGAPGPLKSYKAFRAWKDTLPADRQTQAEATYRRALLRYAYPLAEHFMADFKEVAPGRWLPMSQGYSMYTGVGGLALPASTRTLTVTEVAVDRPLPDELFRITFRAGVDVNNWAHDPPLFYKHKDRFTPEEWQGVLDDARRNQDRLNATKAAQAAAVGQPAPPFPAGAQWLNAPEPLTLEKLRGKVVVIDFFADWCGPCRNDLPTMSQFYKDRQKVPFTVMAVHPPGSKRESVDRLVKEFDLGYPICIDTPSAGAWGSLFAAYRVDSLPQAAVLDREGRIAGRGSLAEVVAIARRLSE